MFDRLETWYLAQCDGDWEHQYGIAIETLDNPGWSVRIDLAGTPLENAEFSEVSNLAPESRWIRCWVENGRFEAACGPTMLTEALRRFLAWANRGAS